MPPPPGHQDNTSPPDHPACAPTSENTPVPQALHTVFGLLLALGNRLNAGSVRAGAAGFRFDASLLQIVAMRCAAPPGSLAAFLARHMERSAPGLLAKLAAELELLREVAKQPEVAEQQQELQRLSAELRTVRQTLAEVRRDRPLPLPQPGTR